MSRWANPKVLKLYGLEVQAMAGDQLVICEKCRYPLFSLVVLSSPTILANLQADRNYLVCNNRACNREKVQNPPADVLLEELEEPQQTRAELRASVNGLRLWLGDLLDEIVALKVMGWTVESEPGSSKRERWTDAEGRGRPTIPAYSTDIIAARQVLDRLEELGWVTSLQGIEEQGKLIAHRRVTERKGLEVAGDFGEWVPFQLAVCRIGLCAIKMDEEERAAG